MAYYFFNFSFTLPFKQEGNSMSRTMKAFIKKNDRILTLMLVLAIMTMIFCFSAEDAEKSSETSGEIVEVIIDVAYPEFDRMQPTMQEQVYEDISHFVRKAAHFSEFAMLGFSILLHVATLQSRMTIRYPKLISMLIGVLYACSDELHQAFVGGRAPAITDVVIDSVGVLFGVMVMFVLFELNKQKQ